jgi:hypothetical protein
MGADHASQSQYSLQAFSDSSDLLGQSVLEASQRRRIGRLPAGELKMLSNSLLEQTEGYFFCSERHQVRSYLE